jgi:hypothetical protein
MTMAFQTSLRYAAVSEEGKVMIQNQIQANDPSYRRLKEQIDDNYAKGWFVAVRNWQIAGASERFDDLAVALRAAGIDPRTVLVIQAGANVPEQVTIFA